MSPETLLAAAEPLFLPRAALAGLIDRLQHDGYTVIGPRAVDGIIAMREIESVDDLPLGVRDEQHGGAYRLVEGDPQLTFEYVVGPEGLKRYLFPPSQPLMQLRPMSDGFRIEGGLPDVPQLAFLGARPCELAAAAVQDRVFGYDDPRTFYCESEPWYNEVRRKALVIAVNCTRPGGTCFCTSWNTGPEATTGYDLAMTELRDGFVVALGTPRGAALLDGLATRPPTGAELELAQLKLAASREHMGRRLQTSDVKRLLDENVEHPEWDRVAERCLACGNCTMVCPTCFCSTVSDATDLSGDIVTRTREWESCFTMQFSYMVGGPGRNTTRGRYRHWLRHKLCTWWDQFSMSGCVGCGRCITWCPVAIDLTEEIQKIRQSAESQTAAPRPPS